MATKTWIGNAAAVKQIDTITVAGTWANGDTVTLTINGKDLVVTIGDDVTPANVATSIRDAWNATSRLDSETGGTDATSNFGGQEFGEFSEAEASIDDDALTVVEIIARKSGVPFTLSVTETTAGDGAATEATATAATGPNHWSNADNWDTGTVPANDDVVVFRDSDVSVLYGLPNGSLEVTMQVYQSYTGAIGLPAVNRQNQSKPYQEYRQRYVRLDDAGTGTESPHRFGIGKDGSGSTLINITQTGIKGSPVVYNTGTPQIPGTKALNICCTVTTSTLNILAGSVDFSSQDGSTSAFAIVIQTGGDSRGINGHNASATVVVSGGSMLIGGTATLSSLEASDGAAIRAEGQTGTITQALAYAGGTIDYASTAIITLLTLQDGGVFDARSGAGVFTVTSTEVYKGGRLIDPTRRITFTNDGNLYADIGSDLQLGGHPSTAILFNR